MIQYKKRWFDGGAAALFLCMSAWAIQWAPLNVAWSDKQEVIQFDFSSMFQSEFSKPFLTYLIDPVEAQPQATQTLDLPKIQQSMIENERLQANTVLDVASGFFRLNEKALLLQWMHHAVGSQLKNLLADPEPLADSFQYQAGSQSYMFGQKASARKSVSIKEPNLNATSNEDVLKRHQLLAEKNPNQTNIFSKEVFNLLKQAQFAESQKQIESSSEQAADQSIEQNVHAFESNAQLTILNKNKPEKKRILHDENLERVKALMNDRQLSLATTQLQMYVNQYPAVSGYRVLLGEIYLKNKQYTSLKNLILSDAENQENPRELMELLARAYIDQHNYDEALALLNQYNDNIEKAPTTHGLIANIYQRMQVYDKAATIYSQLVQYFPQAGKWWLGLAISLEGQRRNPEALGAYQKALNDDRLQLGLKSYAKERVDYLTQKVKKDS